MKASILCIALGLAIIVWRPDTTTEPAFYLVGAAGVTFGIVTLFVDRCFGDTPAKGTSPETPPDAHNTTNEDPPQEADQW